MGRIVNRRKTIEVLEAIKTRRSIRKYKTAAIDDSVLEQILEAARWAPSWKNSQCWRFIMVRNDPAKAELAETLSSNNQGRNAIKSAPILIVACAEKGKAGFTNGTPRTIRGDWAMFDVALAMENIAIAARGLGLGTVHIGLFDHKKVETMLAVPEGYCVMEMMPLGYPDGEAGMTSRKELSEIVFQEKFGGI